MHTYIIEFMFIFFLNLLNMNTLTYKEEGSKKQGKSNINRDFFPICVGSMIPA